MYVKNGKISSRQTFRLYVFDLMGIATLLLPPYLAQLCGVDGVFAIVLGTGAGFVYLLYLGWIMKKMGKDICSFLEENSHGWIRTLMYLQVFFHSILTAGFCAYVFTNLMQYSLISETSYATILLVILLVSSYAVSGGIESRARVYEVLFWFVLFPYVAMMIASVRNVSPVYMEEFLKTDGESFLKGSYLVFLLLTPLFYMLFLIGEKEKKYGRNIVKTVAFAIFLSAVILLGSYVILIGNFGSDALASMRYPVVTLMSTIQFKGNFLKRMDALMLAIWFFTLYALLNLHLHYGVNMFHKLLKRKKSSLSWWGIGIPAVFVFGIAWTFSKGWTLVDIFLKYYSYYAVPFMLIAPIILLLCRKKNVKGELYES